MQHLAVSLYIIIILYLVIPKWSRTCGHLRKYLSHFPVLLESLESLECPIVLCEKTPCSACARPLLFGLLNGFLLLKGRNLTGFVGIQVSPPDFRQQTPKKTILKKKKCGIVNINHLLVYSDCTCRCKAESKSKPKPPLCATFSAETAELHPLHHNTDARTYVTVWSQHWFKPWNILKHP